MNCDFQNARKKIQVNEHYKHRMVFLNSLYHLAYKFYVVILYYKGLRIIVVTYVRGWGKLSNGEACLISTSRM